MKTFTLTLTLILSFHCMHAAIITVNNNPNESADYVKLQDAINNASDGDTVFIVGAPNYYDTDANGRAVEIRINKTLTLIGPGYFLGENEKTQASSITAKVYAINLGEGADNTVITGMDFSAYNSNFNINKERYDESAGQNAPKNLKILRNKIRQIYLTACVNTLIEENYMGEIGYSDYPVNLYKGSSNTIIRNNIIINSNQYATIFGTNDVELINTVIKNNTLSSGLFYVHGVDVENNIFINGGLNDCDNNVLKNNLFTSPEDGVISENSTGNTLSNSVYGAVAANLFMKPDPILDADYRLAENSPAKGVGLNGEDVGAYSSPNSYVLSGLPSVPAIYELSVSGIGTPETGMPVTIKVKSNQ